MDQISRPFQIALLLAVAFLGVWFVALRPKPEEAPPPPKPVAAQPSAKASILGPYGDALDTARGGAAQADAAAASRPGRADSASGDASAGDGPFGRALGANPSSKQYRSGSLMGTQMRSVAVGGDNSAVQSGVVALSLVGVTLAQVQTGQASDVATGGASPASVERALSRRKTVVLLFYGRGADDRGVRSELAKVSSRGGRVAVMSAPVGRVAQFGSVTRGVRVLEAPTVVVVGPARQGRAVAGFADSTEIDQAVLFSLRGR